MKAIKRQFVDFFNYFRMFRCCGINSNANRHKLGRTIVAYIFFFVALSLIMMQSGDFVNFFFGAMVGGALGVCLQSSVRPSALSIAPFSPAQRVIFNFLCALIMALIWTLAITLFSFIVVLLLALLVFAVMGENVFVVEASSPEAAEYVYSGYGVAYILLLSVFVYFAIYAICNLKTGRAKVISGVSLLVLLEIFSLIMVNLFDKDLYTFYMFRFAADVPLHITELAHPWVPILILSVASALALAAAVFLSIRRFKSDKT